MTPHEFVTGCYVVLALMFAVVFTGFVLVEHRPERARR